MASFSKYRKRRTYRRRRYARKKPVYVRRARRAPLRRLTSRRRILNFTSVKKQDNMQPYVVTSPATGAGTNGPINFAVSSGLRAFVFMPTARTFDVDGVAKDEPSARTKQLTYARGYAEHSRLSLAGSTGWIWRRICFTAKGTNLISGFAAPSGGVVGQNSVYAYTTNGYVRTLYQTTGDPGWVPFYSYLFRGSASIDWNDIMTAKVDTTVVTLKSDRSRVLNPNLNGNKMFDFKDWMPMNHNLMYSDDELGTTLSGSPYSAYGKPGQGDYYVVDLFQPGSGGSSSDNITWQPEGTYYWHEK